MGKKKRKIITALLTALLSCGFISAVVQPMETQAGIVIKTNNSDTSSKTFTGIKKENGVYKVFKNGSVNTAYTGLDKYPEDGKWYYFAKGIHDASYTGFAKSTDGKWYYVRNGAWDKTYTGFAKSVDGKWCFARNGRYDNTYTGLAKNASNGGWFYAVRGIYKAGYTGIAKSTDGKLYFVRNSKWDKTYTGLGKYTDGKWYYVKNGAHVPNYTGIAVSTDGKYYYAENGVWNKTYTGYAKNTDGKWYFVRNGRHDSTYTGLAKNKTNGGWFYAEKGIYKTGYTGIAKSTDNKLYYVKGSKWDQSYTGLGKYTDGKWYYVKNGRHEAYTGFAQNENGWWYVENGIVTLKKNGNIKGNVDGISSTWIVKNSRVEGENKPATTHTHSYTTPVYKTVHHNEVIDDSEYETNVVTYAGMAVYMFSHGAHGMGQKDTIIQHYNSCDESLEAYTYVTGETYPSGKGMDAGLIPGITIDPNTGKSIKDENGNYKYPKLWVSPAFNYKFYLNNCQNGPHWWTDYGTCIVAYKPQKVIYRKITPAYDEKILTGHKCSCGAIKDTTDVSQTKTPATQNKTIIKNYDILWYHQYPDDFKTFVEANPEFKKHASLTTTSQSDERPGPESTNIYNYYKTYPYMKDYKGYGPDSYLKTHSGEAALNANKTIH